MNPQQGSGPVIGPLTTLATVAALVGTVWLWPVLAELTRGPVADLIRPRHTHQIAEMLLTGYEWLVPICVFLALRSVLALAASWASFLIIRRSLTP